jgi:FAD/FMN-containing dehydrogenase
MEILTGDGRVVVATEGQRARDLFYGFPNSYGTLGYSLSLTIELSRSSRTCTCGIPVR